MLKRIRQFLHRKPFSPFRIVMKSGERHEVEDPDRVALPKPDVFLFKQGDRMLQLKENDIELVYEPRSPRR